MSDRPKIKDGWAYDKDNRVAYYDLRVGGRNGRRLRKIQRDIGYRDALKLRTTLRDKLKQDLNRPLGRARTMEEYLKAYPKRLGTHKESTLARHREFQSRHVLPHFGSHELDRISRATVMDWRNTLLDSGLSPSTVNRCVAHLIMLLNEAVDRAEIATRPCGKIKPLEEPREREVYLRRDQRQRFLDTFEDFDLFGKDWDERRRLGPVVTSMQSSNARRCGGGPKSTSSTCRHTFERYSASMPFFLAALETGADRGDLLSLRVGDLDFEIGNGLIRYTRAKTGVRCSVPMTSVLREALLSHLDQGPATMPSALVFCGLSVNRVRRYFASAKRLSGIDVEFPEGFRFKDLRHTFASTLVQSGTDLYTVSKLMGHTSPRMTQRYAHLAEGDLQDAISAMEEFNVGNNVAKTRKAGEPPTRAQPLKSLGMS